VVLAKGDALFAVDAHDMLMPRDDAGFDDRPGNSSPPAQG
jgi:hypothetical protein